ncbi:MAG: cbb3-type cytochrome c oxidase subunit I, partial [Proteobacteria bacterium]|nr:cbb3-type cytochrome c oxidase subunit I [Pseudomonadota bacterium]
PQLTGREFVSPGLVRTQLWLWFIGMMVLTLPWHWAGLLGMPRRMAYFDYRNPQIAPEAWTVIIAVFGGALLVLSGLLFIWLLAFGHKSARNGVAEYRFSVALHESATVPRALNGFAVWLGLMMALTLVNYGFPIWQLMQIQRTSVPAVYEGGAP